MPFQKGNKLALGRRHSEESKEKMRIAKLGKKLSEETKKKIGISNKNKVFTDEWKENISKGLIGRPVSKKTRKKHSRNAKKLISLGILGQSGEKASNWQGGKTKLSFLIRGSIEYSVWRMEVFKRDNWTCQKCGKKRKKGDRVIIQAHHIYPVSKIIKDERLENIQQALSCKKLWDIAGGETLCRECHKKTDSYGSNQYSM